LKTFLNINETYQTISLVDPKINVAEITAPILFPVSLNLLQLAESFFRKKTTKEVLAEVQSKINNGATELDIADEYFDIWVKYARSIQRYCTLKTPSRDIKITPNIIVVQGPTGTGKSRWAMEQYPDAYWKQRSIWWDGYAGHATVIIDEFYGWLPWDVLLRVCDRYPLLVETKGGNAQFVAANIIITTNAIPATWYKNIPSFDPFKRRVTTWMVMPTLGEIHSYSDYNEARFIDTATPIITLFGDHGTLDPKYFTQTKNRK